MHTILTKVIAAGVSLGMTLASSAVPPALENTSPAVEISNSPEASEGTKDVRTPLDRWIDKLVEYESHGRTQIKILDHNGYYSYGCLQFQMPTFKAYVERYGLLPEAEDSELQNMIYDCDFQKSLTKRMIQEDSANWQHWYTSVAIKGLGEPPLERELAKK